MDDLLTRDTRFVVGGTRLLTTEAVEGLRSCDEIRSLVLDMRELEGKVSCQMEGLARGQLHGACRQAIAGLVPGVDLVGQCGDLDAVSFARAVYGLPRKLSDTHERRLAREVARTYANLCGDGLVLPQDVGDFRRLWEMAMEGEPRWSDGFPTSEFRKTTAVVITSPFSGEVTQVCTEPDNVEPELEQLLSFLSNDSLGAEVRAACGFLSLEFTHPFADGNGHVGRMLLLAMLQESYSLPTMLCLSRELALARAEASYQFALVRSGEHTVADFCLATLSLLREAQRGAVDLLSSVSAQGARSRLA